MRLWLHAYATLFFCFSVPMRYDSCVCWLCKNEWKTCTACEKQWIVNWKPKKHPSTIKSRLDFSYTHAYTSKTNCRHIFRNKNYRLSQSSTKTNWNCTVEQKKRRREKKTKIIARNKFDQQYLFKHNITTDFQLILMVANGNGSTHCEDFSRKK